MCCVVVYSGKYRYWFDSSIKRHIRIRTWLYTLSLSLWMCWEMLVCVSVPLCRKNMFFYMCERVFVVESGIFVECKERQPLFLAFNTLSTHFTLARLGGNLFFYLEQKHTHSKHCDTTANIFISVVWIHQSGVFLVGRFFLFEFDIRTKRTLNIYTRFQLTNRAKKEYFIGKKGEI